jgi:hypothetical protein
MPYIKLPDGTPCHVLIRGRRGSSRRTLCRDCQAIGQETEAVALCDGPGAKPGKTCDRGMCARHVAAQPQPDRDLCSRCASQPAVPDQAAPTADPELGGSSVQATLFPL